MQLLDIATGTDRPTPLASHDGAQYAGEVRHARRIGPTDLGTLGVCAVSCSGETSADAKGLAESACRGSEPSS